MSIEEGMYDYGIWIRESEWVVKFDFKHEDIFKSLKGFSVLYFTCLFQNAKDIYSLITKINIQKYLRYY